MNEDNQPAQVTKGELKALMQQIKDLTTLVTNSTENKDTTIVENGRISSRQKQQHTVTIMFVNGKPVVGLANLGSDMNPVRVQEVTDPRDRTKTIMQSDLLVQDLTTNEIERIKNINFMEFLQEGERRECTVIKSRGEEWVMEQGSVLKKEVNDYRTVELDVEVPVEIHGTERYFIVDINGKGIEIHEDWVNMAKSTPRPQKQFINNN